MVDIANSNSGERVQGTVTTNAESESSPEEETQNFTVSQDSTNEPTGGTVGTSEFIVTSNEQSFEEAPAMDVTRYQHREKQSIEAQNSGFFLGGVRCRIH